MTTRKESIRTQTYTKKKKKDWCIEALFVYIMTKIISDLVLLSSFYRGMDGKVGR